jgi:hypothetical protein
MNKIVALIFRTRFVILSFWVFYAIQVNAATFVVDNATNPDLGGAYVLNDGTNTLRKCVRLAEATPEKDTISFNLPGPAPYIITLVTGLNFANPILINGFSQTGASPGNLLVQLNSSAAINMLNLNAGSTGSTIQGLVIYGPGSTGIRIFSSDNIIKGNYIGTNVTGTAAGSTPALSTGISLSGAQNCIIGGTSGINTRNIIAGNSQRGIYIQASSHGTIVQGNYIGVNVTGNAALANGTQGIDISASNNQTIGGNTYASRNIISGNTNNGILVNNCTGLTLKGNFIGLGQDGTTSVANGQVGLSITTSTPRSANVVIGGLTSQERNVISSNGTLGMNISTVDGLTIQNNYLGVDSTGLIAKGNGSNNMTINTSTSVLIGGNSYSARNIICSTVSNNGINISACSTSVVIKGNFIGLGADGITPLGNKTNGINIQTSSPITIGGSTVPERNIISSNFTSGMVITTSTIVSVTNNYVGTDSTGLLARGNSSMGISITNSSSVEVGGASYNLRNIVCNSLTNNAINISACSTAVNIRGNFIGLGKDGTTSWGNRNHGISVQTSSPVNIGGPTVAERNIISNSLFESGVYLNNCANATIVNNYIGTDSTGMIAKGNAQMGMTINSTNSVQVGGSTYNLRNIICSSLGSHAINIIACSTAVNIKGNFIGVGKDGTTSLGNRNYGISVQTSTPVNIGGPTLAERNIIANSLFESGLYMNNCVNATIVNNFIGTDSTGMLAKGNAQMGMSINNTNNVQIGGATYNLRNIICNSSGSHAINISACSTAVNIKGNFIGLAKDGTTTLANRSNGINIQTSSPVNIGGPTKPERNLISNSLFESGIRMNNCATATIQNNYIGTDSTGLLNKGNKQVGINVSGTTGLIIGGSSFNLRNLVCANQQNGMSISTCPGVIIKGNFVGLGIDGSTILGNSQHGMLIQTSAGALIGGTSIAERNLISNCGQNGMEMITSSNSVIVNNYFGVDSTGMLVRGNSGRGVYINNSADVVFGGSVPLSGNIIANSGQTAFALVGTLSPRGIIKGNILGLAIDGSTSMPNLGHGMEIVSRKAIIGGTTLAERNLIANSRNQGIQATSSDTIKIVGNYIGVDVTGLLNRGNGDNGININSSVDVVIGGSNYVERNIVSGNGDNGIRINGNSYRAIIKGNFCGLGKDGSTIISNTESGILFTQNCDSAVVGGSLYSERNVCSSNGMTALSFSRDGIRFESGSKAHVIKGNYCGVDSTGTLPRGNFWAGISINECKNTIVGGTGPNDGNISCDNFNEGIYLRNDTNCVFIGNYIGTDKTRTIQLGNHDYGINADYNNYQNIIGGATIAEGNTIAYNKGITIRGAGAGISIDSSNNRNKIVRNKIYCNFGEGISLEPYANESILAPVVTISDPNFVSGTGSIDGDSIHVYITTNTGGDCNCEGETFLGGGIVSGGVWTINHNLNLTIPQTLDVTATETTLNNSTSEFSTCLNPLPVEWLSFEVSKLGEEAVHLQWSTATEKNNSHFLIQRSSDGVNFQVIGKVNGIGTTNEISTYNFNDMNPGAGIVYYQITQIDMNGDASSTEIKAVSFSKSSIVIINTGSGIRIVSSESIKGTFGLLTVHGQKLIEDELEVDRGSFEEITVDLAEGVYIVYVQTAEEFISQKILLVKK